MDVGEPEIAPKKEPLSKEVFSIEIGSKCPKTKVRGAGSRR